jgi:hypothetical protein
MPFGRAHDVVIHSLAGGGSCLSGIATIANCRSTQSHSSILRVALDEAAARFRAAKRGIQ